MLALSVLLQVVLVLKEVPPLLVIGNNTPKEVVQGEQVTGSNIPKEAEEQLVGLATGNNTPKEGLVIGSSIPRAVELLAQPVNQLL